MVSGCFTASTSASIVLTFGVTLEGLLINNATSGLGDVNVTKSAAGFEYKNPNMTVEKRTLTPQVDLGNQTIFEIIVRNTGDVDLDNVFVCESKYDSELVYVGFVSRQGTWKHSVNKDGKHVFTLSEVLEIDDSASFRVIFKTTKAGNFTNTVTAGFNDTVVSNSTNTTEVIGNDTPDVPVNEKDNTTTESPVDEDDVTDISQDSIDETQKTVLKPEIDEKATGNPLLALMLALIFIPLRRFRK